MLATHKKTFHLLVNLTWKCQNTCPYCWTVILGRPSNQPPFHTEEVTWKAWQHILNSLSPSIIDFAGGEPFLYPDFIQLVKGLETHLIAVSTNLAADNVVKDLIECKRHIFNLTCSWHKGQSISFMNFLEKVLKLKKAGLKPTVNIVNSPHYNLGFPSKDWLNLWKLRILTLRVNVSPFENPYKICRTNNSLICNAGVNTFTVDPKGDVYRCLTWFRYKDRNQELLGNLFRRGPDLLTLLSLKEPRSCNLRCEIHYVLNPQHKQKNMFSTIVKEA